MHECDSFFLATTTTARSWRLSDYWRSSLLTTWLGKFSHLKDNFEGCVEHLIQSSFLLGRADDESLEGMLSGGFLDLFVRDALIKFGLVTGTLGCIAKIKFCANKDARALPRRRLHLGYPFIAGVVQ